MKKYIITINNFTLNIFENNSELESCDIEIGKKNKSGDIPNVLRLEIDRLQKGLPISEERLRKFLLKRGTEFQKKVWKEITLIPWGETRTYGEIAKKIGSPNASRAVGSACGANTLALFIPCHRVVGKNKNSIHYRWGSEIKKKLLLEEVSGR